MKKIIVISAIITFLFSCYSQKIILNGDGKSGQMVIEYAMDDDFYQLLSIAAENFSNAGMESGENESVYKLDPAVLVDKQLFANSFKAVKEVKLKSVDIQTIGGRIKGKIVIEFQDLQKLFEMMPAIMKRFSLKRENGNVIIEHSVDYNRMDPDGVLKGFVEQQRKEDVDLYNRLTRDVKFNFSISGAGAIKRSDGASLSVDRKQAGYSFSLADVLSGSNRLKFLISF